MDSLARAREAVIACGWTTEGNPDVPFDDEDVRRIATAIDEARLEEREEICNWIETTDEPMIPLDEWKCTKREFGAKVCLALAASLREGGKV